MYHKPKKGLCNSKTYNGVLETRCILHGSSYQLRCRLKQGAHNSVLLFVLSNHCIHLVILIIYMYTAIFEMCSLCILRATNSLEQICGIYCIQKLLVLIIVDNIAYTAGECYKLSIQSIKMQNTTCQQHTRGGRPFAYILYLFTFIIGLVFLY